MTQVTQWLTIFRDDDITTVDGVVADPIPTPSQATCSTDPGHARPFLFLDQHGVDRQIQLNEAAVNIGAASIKIQDARRLAGQGTGWLTQLIAGAGGVNQLFGCRIVLTQQDVWSGAPYVVWNQTIQSCRLENNNVDFTLALLDIRERERQVGLFMRAETAVIWPRGNETKIGVNNVAPRDGYGRLNIHDPTSKQLIPPSAGYRCQWQFLENFFPAGTYPVGTPVGTFVFPEDRRVPGDQWWENFGQYESIQDGKYILPLTAAPGLFTGTRLTSMTVRWRPWGSSGAWTTLRNMPQYSSPGARNRTRPGFTLNKSYYKSDGSVEFYVGGINASADVLADLPAEGTWCEVQVLSGLPPSDVAPFFYEGTIADFLTKYFAGNYSAGPLDMRYDPTAVAKMTEWMRLVKTEPEDDGQAWVQEHIYKAWGYLPIIDTQGRVAPLKIKIPDPTVPLVTLDQGNSGGWHWAQGLDDAVTVVSFVYKRDYITYDHQLAAIDVTVDDIYAPGYVAAGEHKVEFKPETVRDVTTDVGAAFGHSAQNGDLGFQLARAQQHALIDRFGLGGQHFTGNLYRSNTAVRTLQEGDWVIVDAANIPDLQTGLRGAYRLAQVVSLSDEDPIVRKVECIDAGPHDQPLVAPTISASSLDAQQRVEVTAATWPADANLRLEFAVPDTNALPAADSTLWMFADRQDPAVDGPTLMTSPLLAKTGYVFWRLRAEQPGRRPSVWVTGGGIAVNADLVVLNPVGWLYDQVTGEVRLNYVPGPGVGGVRIYREAVSPTAETPVTLAGHLDVDAAAALPITIGYVSNAQDWAFYAVGYAGFAAGAVTGASGPPTHEFRIGYTPLDLPTFDPTVTNSPTQTTIDWTTNGTVRYKIGSGSYGAPAVGEPPLVVTRPAAGAAPQVVTFEITRAGQIVTQAVSVPAQAPAGAGGSSFLFTSFAVTSVNYVYDEFHLAWTVSNAPVGVVYEMWADVGAGFAMDSSASTLSRVVSVTDDITSFQDSPMAGQQNYDFYVIARDTGGTEIGRTDTVRRTEWIASL